MLRIAEVRAGDLQRIISLLSQGFDACIVTCLIGECEYPTHLRLREASLTEQLLANTSLEASPTNSSTKISSRLKKGEFLMRIKHMFHDVVVEDHTSLL